MPPNTIYVGPRTVWGNPFMTGQRSGILHDGENENSQTWIASLTLDQCLQFFRNVTHGLVLPQMCPRAQLWQERIRNRFGCEPREAIRSQLHGRNLACWCRLDRPCHADVLLEIANQVSVKSISQCCTGLWKEKLAYDIGLSRFI